MKNQTLFLAFCLCFLVLGCNSAATQDVDKKTEKDRVQRVPTTRENLAEQMTAKKAEKAKKDIELAERRKDFKDKLPENIQAVPMAENGKIQMTTMPKVGEAFVIDISSYGLTDEKEIDRFFNFVSKRNKIIDMEAQTITFRFPKSVLEKNNSLDLLNEMLAKKTDNIQERIKKKADREAEKNEGEEKK